MGVFGLWTKRWDDFFYFKEYNAYADSLDSERNDTRMDQLRAAFDLDQKEQEIAIQKITSTVEQDQSFTKAFADQLSTLKDSMQKQFELSQQNIKHRIEADARIREAEKSMVADQIQIQKAQQERDERSATAKLKMQQAFIVEQKNL